MSSYFKRVKTEAHRTEVLRDIKRAPLGFNVRCIRRQRSHDQNDFMWGLLGCFAKQATLRGQPLTDKQWKCVFLEAMGEKTMMLPTLDENGWFPYGHSSSELSVEKMTEMIEMLIAEGTQRGVDMSKYGIEYVPVEKEGVG